MPRARSRGPVVAAVAFLLATWGPPASPNPAQSLQRRQAGRDRTPTPAGTGVIRGRVVTADTGRALPGTVVQLRSDALEAIHATRTDAAGAYAFTDLPPGEYIVVAMREAYVAQRFRQEGGTGAGPPVELGEGQTLDRVDFRLVRGGVISGMVTDAYGEPAVGLRIMAVRFQGGRQASAAGWSETDDRGAFRLYGLRDGDYLVRAEPRQGFRSEASTASPMTIVPTYFPSTPNEVEAQRVAVVAGEESSGVVIRLVEMGAFRVSGRVVNSHGEAVSHAIVSLQPVGALDRFSGGRGTTIDPDGAFELGQVAAGEYRIVVRPQPVSGIRAEFAEQAVTVVDTDVSGLFITTSPGVTVAGSVVLAGDGTPPFRLSAIAILASPESPGGPSVGLSQVAVAEDGSFTLEDVWGPRQLRAYVRGKTGDWALSAVRVNGRDRTDEAIDFGRSGSHPTLEVWFSNRLPVVSGSVLISDDTAATTGQVLLFAQDQQYWRRGSRRVRTAGLNDDGRFELRGVPSGRYYVLALSQLESWEQNDPPTLLRLARQATSVELIEGQRAELSLQMVGRD